MLTSVHVKESSTETVNKRKCTRPRRHRPEVYWLFVFEGVVGRAYRSVWWGDGCVVALGRGRGPPDDGSCYTTQLGDLDVPETNFTSPELTTLLGLDALRGSAKSTGGCLISR